MIIECPFIKVGEYTKNNNIYTRKEIDNIIKIFNEKDSPFFGILGYRDNYDSLPISRITHEVKSLYLNEKGFLECQIKGIKNFSTGIFIESMDPDNLSLLPIFLGIKNVRDEISVDDIMALDIVFKNQSENTPL